MRYISTRGNVEPLTFKQAVMMGLADDGGLLLPETVPFFSKDDLKILSKLSYNELAFEIMSQFADDIPSEDLKKLIERSYSTFNAPLITPLVRTGDLFILELFHGPTLAFKDVALQFLGNIFEYLLKEQGRKMNILGATSGDTGSAAIHGVRGKDNISIFILHPHLKTSRVQALQMTTVVDTNVYNLAVRGNFDDCQNIVKTLFSDLDFKEKYSLGAVNSINWARILEQTVYYFSAYFQAKSVSDVKNLVFSVPTGNFGDIFAGYMAKQMGLPIDHLILATNENNILSRFASSGDYSIGDVVPTISPSMDIQVASNLERYLYFLFKKNSDALKTKFDEFKETGKMHFTPEETEYVKADFLTASVNKTETLETIRKYYRNFSYMLDPHTAVGVAAAEAVSPHDSTVICLATAHPAKFDEAVKEATGKTPEIPESVQELEKLSTRFEIIDPDIEKVKDYIMRNAIV